MLRSFHKFTREYIDCFYENEVKSIFTVVKNQMLGVQLLYIQITLKKNSSGCLKFPKCTFK